MSEIRDNFIKSLDDSDFGIGMYNKVMSPWYKYVYMQVLKEK